MFTKLEIFCYIYLNRLHTMVEAWLLSLIFICRTLNLFNFEYYGWAVFNISCFVLALRPKARQGAVAAGRGVGLAAFPQQHMLKGKICSYIYDLIFFFLSVMVYCVHATFPVNTKVVTLPFKPKTLNLFFCLHLVSFVLWLDNLCLVYLHLAPPLMTEKGW